MPLVCNYYLTLRCNARCRFCDLWSRPETTPADTAQVLNNLRQLPKAGVRIVDFTGGEPLLHPDLPRILAAARSLGLRTTVTTNALLYPKRAADLRGLVNLLHFSIDGATAEEHDHLRGVPCFDRVLESLDLAISLGERPELLFTAMRENFRSIETLADLAQYRRVILIVNPLFGATGDASLLNPSELNELIALCRRPFVYLNGGVARLARMGGNDPLRPRCRAISATIVISPENELLLPCFHHAQSSVPIAGDLRRALDSPERQKWLNQQGRADFCRGCTINCYLAPSLVYRLDRHLTAFAPWAIKYFYYKWRFKPRSGAAVQNYPAAA